MSTNAGTLLWNRRRITLLPGETGITDVDTGLRQPQLAFGNSSIDEPPLGISGTAPPVPGTTPASRVEVIPQAPLSPWLSITHSEPWFNTVTGTVFVTFKITSEIPLEINVLFWDPHTAVGPGQADTYNAPPLLAEPGPVPIVNPVG